MTDSNSHVKKVGPKVHNPLLSAGLNKAHLRQLREGSGIALELIEGRGYRSLTSAGELKSLGFSPRQCRLGSGLLIPILSIDGQPVLHQFRPDHPRHDAKNRVIKYETPAKSRMRLDMGVDQQEQLHNPAIPLWITEGLKKGDAGQSHGLCMVSLLGVYNFRGRNTYDGLTTLGEWEEIALNNGRQVLIAFDSDVTRKRDVWRALQRLKRWLGSKGAKVTLVYLPEGEAGQKVGLDDYLLTHTVEELYGLAKMPAPPPPDQVTLLDEAPPQITRPLCLVDGKAHIPSDLVVDQ